MLAPLMWTSSFRIFWGGLVWAPLMWTSTFFQDILGRTGVGSPDMDLFFQDILGRTGVGSPDVDSLLLHGHCPVLLLLAHSGCYRYEFYLYKKGYDFSEATLQIFDSPPPPVCLCLLGIYVGVNVENFNMNRSN